MAKTIRGVCVYCANEDEITKDHVIPQCLFPGGVPIDVPKVWACEPCNGIIKSRLDTYFRDLLVIDMHSSQSPVAQNLSQKFARALGRNQSKLARDIVQNNQLIELRTESGLFWGHAYTSQEANKKTLEIIAMYVRGLYAAYLHKILPQDVEFDIIQVSKSAALNDVLGLLNEKGGSYARIGNGDIKEIITSCSRKSGLLAFVSSHEIRNKHSHPTEVKLAKALVIHPRVAQPMGGRRCT